MTARSITVAAACGAALVIHLAGTPCDAQEDDALIARIREEWGRLQDQVGSFEAEWEQTTTDLKVDPPNVVTGLRVLKCDGDQVYFQRSGREQHASAEWGTLVDRTHTSVYNGSDRRWLWEGEDHGRHPSGFINSQIGFTSSDQNDYTVLGPLLAYRPLVTELGGIDLGEYRLAEQRWPIDGQECRLLERQVTADTVKRVWVADGGDFRILRQDLIGAEGPIYEMTLEYSDESDPRKLSGWSNLLFLGVAGAPSEWMECRVTRHELNPVIDPATFNFAFPPGTVILDEVSHGMSIVRPDGTWRPVARGELGSGKSWEEIMSSPPLPDAVPAQGGPEGLPWSWIAGAIGLLVLCAWERHRRRSNGRGSTT
jgi:hypothetical protein